MNEEKTNVIFFDGVCGLCNGFVDFVMKNDRKHQFYFSPLQSGFAAKTLPKPLTQDLKSIVVQINGVTFQKSEAVFQVLAALGGPLSAFSIFHHLPKPVLNWGYDLVASNRYRIFGRKETCRLPNPEERGRFIL